MLETTRTLVVSAVYRCDLRRRERTLARLRTVAFVVTRASTVM